MNKKPLLTSTATLLLVAISIFILTGWASAQTPASATWPLTANATPTTTGNMSAANQNWGSWIAVPGHSLANGAIAAASTGNPGWSNAILDTNAYYEYAITCTPGNTLTVDTVSFYYSVSAGTMNAAVYYSFNNFTTSTQLGSNITGISNTTSNVQFVNTTPITVNSAVTLKLRVYGWGAGAANRNFRNRNFFIYGTTVAAPIAYLNPYTTQLSGSVVRGSVATPLAGFTITPPGLPADFNSVTVSGVLINPVDVSNLTIYRDYNGDGIINNIGGNDGPVSAPMAFNTNMTFNITGETGFSTVRSYLIVGDISSASISPSIQLSVTTNNFQTTLANIGSMPPVTRAIPPANDFCSNAITLIVGAPATPGNISTATPSGNTFSYAPNKNDVWYNFTPFCSGLHTVVVSFGLNQDIDLDIFNTSCPAGGSAVLYQHGTGATSKVITNYFQSGSTYYIRIIDYNGTAGPYNIRVTSANSDVVLDNAGTPPTEFVTSNTNNTALFGFSFTQNVCVSKYDLNTVSINTAGTATATDISNFRIFADVNANGQLDAGDTNVVVAAQPLSSTMNFTFAGQTNLVGNKRYLLVGDIAPNAILGRTFTGTIVNGAAVSASLYPAGGTVIDSAYGNTQTISCGNPDTLAFVIQPTSVSQNQTMPTVTVKAFCRATGETALNYTGPVTIHASDNGCGLSGLTQTVNAVAGVASFSNISFTRSAQNGITLTATAAGPGTAVSNPFNVTLPAGAVDTLPSLINNTVINCPNVNVGIGIQSQNAPGILTYSWSPKLYMNDSTLANPTVNPPGNQVYNVTVVDSEGCAAHGTVTIQIIPSHSDVVISNAGTPPAQDITSNTINTVLFGFDITPNNCVVKYDLNNVKISTSGTATAADVTNVRIYDDANGDGQLNAGDSNIVLTPQAYAATMNFTCSGQTNLVGNHHFLLVADIAPNAVLGHTIIGAINAGSDVSTINYPDGGNVTGTAAGSTQTIVCGNPDSLVFVIEPVSVAQNDTMPVVTVKAICSQTGATAVNYTGAVTIHSSNNGCGLGGLTQTVNAVAGIASFNTIYFTRSAQLGITLTATATNLAATASTPFDVTIPANSIDTMPTLIPNAFVNCPNRGVVINILNNNAHGALTYAWSPNTYINDTTLANPTVNPPAATTYQVTVTDSEGCAAHGTVAINMHGGNIGIWTGLQSRDWFDCANWGGGVVPDSSVDVVIDSTALNAAEIDPTTTYAIAYGGVARAKNINVVHQTLQIDNAATLWAAGGITIGDTALLDMTGGGLFKLEGNWKNQVGNTGFIAGTGIVQFQGTAMDSLTTVSSNETFHQLNVNGTGSQSLTLLNDLLFNAGGSIQIAGGVLDAQTYSLASTEDLTMTGGELMTAKDGSLQPEMTGTISLTGGTIHLYGAGTGANAQTIRPLNYYSLKSSSTGDRILSPTGVIGIANSFVGGGNTYTVTGSAVDFNGSVAQFIPFLKTAAAPPYTYQYNILKVSGSNTKTIPLGFIHSLTILDSLKIGAGATLYLDDVTVIIKSDSSHTAHIGQVEGTFNQGTGVVTVERFIPGHPAWRLLTIPDLISGQTINMAWQESATSTTDNPAPGYGTHITGGAGHTEAMGYDISPTNNASILTFGGTDWNQVPATTNAYFAATEPGYMLYVRGSRNIDLTNYNPLTVSDNTVLRPTGKTHVGPVSLNNLPAGFSVVGNPYASAINFTNLAASGVEDTYYLYDSKIPGADTVGAFITYSDDGTHSGNYIASILKHDAAANIPADGTIQSGAAFMVYSAANGSLQINEKDKVWGSSNLQYRQAPAVNQIRTSLYTLDTLTGANAIADGNVVSFASGYNNLVDALDAKKISNFAENFGMIRFGQKLSIERKDILQLTDTIFYDMTHMKQRDYQLEFIFDQVQLPANCIAFLEDLYLHNRTPVNTSDTTRIHINIGSDPGSQDEYRFRLIFVDSLHNVPVSFETVKAWRLATANNTNTAPIQIQWAVGNELNIDHYMVERSADARHFSGIATQTALGNQNNGNHLYNSIDPQPLSGINYYRIRSIGNNGLNAYSPIVKVMPAGTHPMVQVVPNPSSGQQIALQITDLPAGKYRTSLYNALGQLLLVNDFEYSAGSLTQTLHPVSPLKAGVYEIRVKGDGGDVVGVKVVVE